MLAMLGAARRNGSREGRGNMDKLRKIIFGKAAILAGASIGMMSLLIPKLTAEATEPEREHEVVEHPALITTSASAEIKVRPDSMHTDLGVRVEAKTLSEARNDLASRMRRLTKAIADVNVKGLSVRTSQLDISPIETEAKEGRPSRIVGYRAESSLRLRLEGVALEELGDVSARIIDAGVRAGANRVEGVSFYLANPEPEQARALKLAVKKAEAQARVMAEAAGVRLGTVQSLDGSPGHREYAYRKMLMAASFEGGGGAPTPIEPGEITISAEVSVKYHIQR